MTFYTDAKHYDNLKPKKTVILTLDKDNEEAFYAIAPLSYSLLNRGIDLYVTSSVTTMSNLMKIYKAFEEKDKDLMAFIDMFPKSHRKEFMKIFQRPDMIETTPQGFLHNGFVYFYKTTWVKKVPKLRETARRVWEQVFNLRKNEKTNIVFELAKKSDVPLQDLLDNFMIARAMYNEAKSFTRRVNLAASTSRESMLDSPNPVAELIATLNGCLYEKDINEPIFKKFKKLADKLNLKLSVASAVFGVFGKGYHGKHMFGEHIGYPTKNRKSRWNAPAQMFYKFSWYPQSKYETRDPVSRVGFTSTVPVKEFIRTSNIDWFEMAKRNMAIKKIEDKCKEIHVESSKTNFVVSLVRKNGKRRKVMVSDIDVRCKYDKEYYKETGIKCGTMGNIPGGEAFVTPEAITGRLYGDVVMSIDDSYVLSEKDPLVIDMKDGFYEVVKGPRKVVNKIKEKKEEAWKRLLEQEKNKSLPKNIIDLKKKNFERVGEFAINTNPKARLTRYLIINEKIANMIHVAIGSGFEEDRATEYHWDIVINAKKQKLDIYGVTPKGKKIYILKKGKFVV